ncbi:hypothetical protein L1887_63341 [Cichorium endivia]|nr:hypothetical protein L1887_63341 [Cichorium endivia]
MICEFFKHLNLKDLLTCSLVSKRWYSVYSSFRPSRLAAIDKWIEEEKEEDLGLVGSLLKQHILNKNLPDNEACDHKLFARLIEKPLLSKLKRLMIDESRSFTFDCPELSALTYSELPDYNLLLNLKRPETIKKLKTRMVGFKLAAFKNVECLIGSFEAINKETLLRLPKLNELQCNESFSCLLKKAGTLVGLKRTLHEFGVNAKLRCPHGPEEAFNEYVYLKNYQLIHGTLDFIRKINYNRLIEVTRNIPSCFPKKFVSVVEVSATVGVQDEKHFLEFLKSLSSVRRLFLCHSQLSQTFLDELPASAHSLTRLELRTADIENGLELQFDSIRKLNSLTWLYFFVDEVCQLRIRELRPFRNRTARGRELSHRDKQNPAHKLQAKLISSPLSKLMGVLLFSVRLMLIELSLKRSQSFAHPAAVARADEGLQFGSPERNVGCFARLSQR